jgi:small-conductance mechanosensitive channel
MIAPIDFSRLKVALSLPHGWLELLVTVVCIAIGWYVDRRTTRSRRERLRHVHLRGGFVHLAFPLVALLLVYIASLAWHRYVHEPFFLAIAFPILIALAIIRMLAYALHRLFPKQTWLPASEVAIGTTIWGFAILYFLGVLPELHDTLAHLYIPFGKTDVSLLTIFTGIAVVVVTLVVTLWISGMIEQRLALATQLDPNLRAVLAKFIRAVLIVVAVLIALEQIGFDLTLLTEIASREPRVLRDAMGPRSFLVNFADNGVTLELGVWINDPHVGQLDLKSSLNRAILREFAAHGIQIPFPQRDVRIVGAIPAGVHQGNKPSAAEEDAPRTTSR